MSQSMQKTQKLVNTIRLVGHNKCTLTQATQFSAKISQKKKVGQLLDEQSDTSEGSVSFNNQRKNVDYIISDNRIFKLQEIGKKGKNSSLGDSLWTDRVLIIKEILLNLLHKNTINKAIELQGSALFSAAHKWILHIFPLIILHRRGDYKPKTSDKPSFQPEQISLKSFRDQATCLYDSYHNLLGSQHMPAGFTLKRAFFVFWFIKIKQQMSKTKSMIDLTSPANPKKHQHNPGNLLNLIEKFEKTSVKTIINKFKTNSKIRNKFKKFLETSFEDFMEKYIECLVEVTIKKVAEDKNGEGPELNFELFAELCKLPFWTADEIKIVRVQLLDLLVLIQKGNNNKIAEMLGRECMRGVTERTPAQILKTEKNAVEEVKVKSRGFFIRKRKFQSITEMPSRSTQSLLDYSLIKELNEVVKRKKLKMGGESSLDKIAMERKERKESKEAPIFSGSSARM